MLLTTHYMEEADTLCDRVALLHRGRLQAVGTPAELKAGLGTPEATLEDVFRHYAGRDLTDDAAGEDFRGVRASRRAAPNAG